jgi:hypothetical protein
MKGKTAAIAIVILSTAALITGVYIGKNSGKKLLNEDLAKAFKLLGDDFESLRRYSEATLSGLHEDPANKPIIPLTEKSSSCATKAELDAQLMKIRTIILREIQKKSSAHRPPNKPTRSQPFLVANGQPFILETQDERILVGIAIKNLGPNTIENLGFFLNGKKTPSRIEEIVHNTTSGSLNEEEKALALWSYVSKNRLHDWPPHSGKEAFDPVKLFSVYGYGFCSHSAKALAILAENAGLKSRVRHAKEQHAVCEIQIDGHWSMFDPDGEVFYRTGEGRIASVDEICSDPNLVLTAQSPIYSHAKLKEIYSKHLFLKTPFEKFGQFTPHEIHIELRPGEELEFSTQKKGLFFASRYLEVPQEYANGSWFYEPVWISGKKLPPGVILKNLAVADSGDAATLKVSNQNLEASVSCLFELPYPILRTRVYADFPSNSFQKNAIQVLASRDGKSWINAKLSVSDGKSCYEFDAFPNQIGRDPDYSFWLKVVMPPKLDFEDFPKFGIALDIQMAPRSLPIPKANGETLVLSYEPRNEQKLEITLINEAPTKIFSN